MANRIDQLFGIHAQALAVRAQRAELLAANIANADTPNYKARDIDFGLVLGSMQDSQIKNKISIGKSQPQHIADDLDGIYTNALRYRVPTHPSLDGNTVDTDLEKSAFSENALRYQISLSILSKKISGLVRTLRGE